MNKVFRFTTYVLLVVGVVALVAHSLWKSSGDSQWQVYKQDDEGLTVYTMKVPGETLLKYKFDMEVNARLTDVVFYMTDINTGAELGAIDLYRIERMESDPVVINYDTYKIDLEPFGMREVVIAAEYSQHPDTGVVQLNIVAAPNKLPVTEGVERIRYLSNHWTMEPLAPGRTRITTTSELDMGLPYFLSNMALADVVYDTTAQMRELLKKDKFKNRTALFVEEPFDVITETASGE